MTYFILKNEHLGPDDYRDIQPNRPHKSQFVLPFRVGQNLTQKASGLFVDGEIFSLDQVDLNQCQAGERSTRQCTLYFDTFRRLRQNRQIPIGPDKQPGRLSLNRCMIVHPGEDHF